jgi:predicted ATPase
MTHLIHAHDFRLLKLSAILAFALVLCSYTAMCLRDVRRAKALVDTGLMIATDKGYPYLMLLGGFVRGWALAEESNAEEGFEASEFERTASRLIEMGSQSYLSLPHGPRSAEAARRGEDIIDT